MADLKTSEPLHVTEVTESNGWYEIKTDGHPNKLKTNREEGGQLAGNFKLKNALIAIQYSERNDKPNPYGGFYHDFYWYSATVVESPSQNGDDGITRVKSTAPAKTPEEAWRIALSVGSDRAVALAPHLPQPQQDFPFIWALSYEFAKRIFLTPVPEPDSLEPLPGSGAAGTFPADPGDDPDDIPF